VTLETRFEEENLYRVRRLEEKIDRLSCLVEEILEDLKPTYKPTASIVVIPARFDK
jgi:tetrahydromethanopterin S-methyltransferase subunit B